MGEKSIKVIGRVEKVSFLEYDIDRVSARIDTGARVSSVWASDIQEANGKLSFTFFGPHSPFSDGKRHEADTFDRLVVSSSMGQAQMRYRVKLLVKIKGKKVRASFTLADRSRQVYPILIGRNILHGKFVVDVATGRPERRREREHRLALQALLNSDKVKE